MYRILKLQFFSWRTKAMTWLGFLLGISFSLSNALKIVRAAKRTGEWICVLEPTIVMGSSAWQSLFLLLGVLLILSDSPFLNDLTPAIVLRTSRKRWFAAQIVYIWLTSALYYLSVSVFSMLLCISVGYPENMWSHLLYAAASGSIHDAEIEFSNILFLKAYSPYWAFAITLFFQIAYAATLEMILFFCNTRLRRGGICIVVLIHVLGYVLFLEGLTGIKKLSLLLHALPAMHGGAYCQGLRFAPTISESAGLFLMINLILIVVLLHTARKFDFASND